MLAESTMPVWHSTAQTVLGELTLVRNVIGLLGIYFPHHWYRPDAATFGPRHHDGFAEAKAQLNEYLSGERREFALPQAVSGDPFQRAVWALIASIPYGETTTYGELAVQLGGTTTAQQVGAAVGRNPLSIVVPCHRVVGRNGKLTGYAGGLARKRYLLDLEGDHASHTNRTPFQSALIAGPL